MKRLIYLSIPVLLLIAAWMGYDMYRLTQLKQFWGYRPLVLELAAWSAVVMLVVALRERRGRPVQWHWWGLATLSGVLLSVGFPGLIPFPWFVFAGFVPLLILEKQLAGESSETFKKRLFPYLFHAFIVWNIISTFWVTNTALAAGLFAIIVNAFLMCLPWLAYHQTRKIIPRFGPASLIVYWITFENLHYHWDLTWPWLTLGNAFAQFYPSVQWYEYTGVFGGSLWVLLLNLFLFRAWEHYRATRSLSGTRWPAIAGLIVLPVALSLIRYYSYPEQGRPEEIVIVQPNYEPHYQKFETPEEAQVETMLQLAAPHMDSTIDYVLFPETVFGYAETSRINDYPAVRRIRDFFRDYPGLKIISGMDAYHDLLTAEPHGRATRERQTADGRTVFFEVYNGAIQITIGQGEVPFYKKSKLVPGAESFPFPWLFFFMKPLVDHLGGTTAGFGTQPRRTAFPGPAGGVGPVICYESVFGEFFTGYIDAGASAAFIMTNDGWWDNTPGHRQHLHYASLRAIETRRSIARAANTGVSAFINQRGDISQATPYGKAAAIRGTLLFNDRITFYVTWKDMIARLSLFLAGLFLLGTIGQDLRKRTGPE